MVTNHVFVLVIVITDLVKCDLKKRTCKISVILAVRFRALIQSKPSSFAPLQRHRVPEHKSNLVDPVPLESMVPLPTWWSSSSALFATASCPSLRYPVPLPWFQEAEAAPRRRLLLRSNRCRGDARCPGRRCSPRRQEEVLFIC
jgi:hypothetical protein